jgi:hypothetical protein
MIVIVTVPFVGLGFQMPTPGTLFDVDDELARKLLGMNVVRRYEMKVDPLPPELKKKGLSE